MLSTSTNLVIDVYYVDLLHWSYTVDEPLVAECRKELLPDTENRKVDQYVQEVDKKMCLASRLLPRYIVNKVTGVPYEKVSVLNRGRNDMGMFKPAYGPPFHTPIDDTLNIWDAYPNFSISHDSGVVCMGVNPVYGVGVDIQTISLPRIYKSAREFVEDMRADVLSEDEYKLIMKDNDDKGVLRGFFRIWTAKESYQKCVGLGFALPMTELRIDPGGDVLRLYNGKWVPQGRHFRLERFSLEQGDGMTEIVGCACLGELALCDPSWTSYRPRNWPSPSVEGGAYSISINLHHLDMSQDILSGYHLSNS
ncbi:Lysophosphatidylcholine acyltransferase 2 [Perkinsus chesapeaki]|uniref:holo-[acyl-carrier-protein] synthase n=1 Tax=Perkinsus chesapeaki TaxID=330153 RepID=A0A7J6LB97_PERCH|nr:Lysophosphatidylcholine acyltransferase 2 [Perkinsus chesapeaki]